MELFIIRNIADFSTSGYVSYIRSYKWNRGRTSNGLSTSGSVIEDRVYITNHINIHNSHSLFFQGYVYVYWVLLLLLLLLLLLVSLLRISITFKFGRSEMCSFLNDRCVLSIDKIASRAGESLALFRLGKQKTDDSFTRSSVDGVRARG